jgi:hypothetical protein
MKIFALTWLLVAGSVWSVRGADVKRFDFNGEGTLTIAVPQVLRVQFGPAAGGQPAHLILADTNRVCEMHMVLGTTNGKLSDDQIKGQLLEAGKKLLSAVVEKEIKVRELKGSAFTYFYFELTDSRADPRQYIVQGLGNSPGYMCEFVMLAKQKSGDPKDQIMNSLRSLDIRARK